MVPCRIAFANRGYYASRKMVETVQKIQEAKVTAANIENVIRFLPRITNLKRSEIASPTRVSRDPGDRSTIVIDAFRDGYRLAVVQLLDALRQNNMVQPYDWGRWQPEAVKYYEGRKSLENASLETCIRLLTLHVRKERFCTGHFGAMIEAGHIQRILKRLTALRKSPKRVVGPRRAR